MHMADALLTPEVGGTLWITTAGTIAYCSHRVQQHLDDSKVPLMGVLGAFVFAAQMVNFTIPGTGSSGHLAGGMILAILLGPTAAFLVMASVLTVQALFFADGGLLALGCNIFNLGIFPCFIAYPLIYRPLAGKSQTPGRIALASVLAAVVALQLGAFSVALETLLSGMAELPFQTFVLLMQPVHLAIGLVEGIVTAAVVNYVRRARPEILQTAPGGTGLAGISVRKVLIVLTGLTVFCAVALSWLASARPDGLEWAIYQVSGKGEATVPADGIHQVLSGLQGRTVIFPDYTFTGAGGPQLVGDDSRPAVEVGTSVAGLVGGTVTLVLVTGVGMLLRRRRPRGVHS